MPRVPQKSYLRAHRLKAGLSLLELAGLLGVTPKTLWNYEAGVRQPPARLIIAAEAIFGVSAYRIFPALYNGIEEDLAIRALAFYDKLAGREDPASRKKLALVGGIPGRLH